MSNLTPELKKQIADEADKYGFVVPYNNSKLFYIEDKVKGYTAGATPYAEKWQEEKQLRERYEKALKDFASRLKEHCEKMGITSIALQRITIDMEEFALTPKTSSDDTANG